MRIAVMNLQVGVGATKGYWQFATRGWRYLLPQASEVSANVDAFLHENAIDIAFGTEVPLGIASAEHAHHFFAPRELDRAGNAIWSKVPLENIRTHALPSGVIPRILSEGSLQIDGKIVHLFVTHLAVGGAMRERQIEAIAKILQNVSGPAILAGDFNERGGSALAAILKTRLAREIALPTFPSWNPRYPLDRLFLTDDFEVSEMHTAHNPFSDHLPLIAEVRLK